ncbi:MAG: SgcJ/EcaC family oxidoreductase [Acidobacteriota bacterium]
MPHSLVLAILFLTAGLLGAQQQDIIAVLQQSVADWNRADIPAFMRCYEDSAETTFVSKAIVKGTTAVRERYRTAYPDAEHMGKLTFSELAVRMLTPQSAIVTGLFALERTEKGGGAAKGIFTLVVRKSAAGWRIIHDHTTSLQ